MSGYHAKLDDKRFTNWIKTCIAIDIFRAYVETFVYKEIEKFHSSILETIANENKTKSNIYCSECRTANVLDCKTNNFCTFKHGKCSNHFPPEHTSRSCPKNICNRIKYFILKCHDFNSPTWQNTSAEKWCYSAWELAKCYMPKGGYFEKQSPAETDLNGIISVMLNNSNISGTIDKSNCEEIRGYCNSLRHTSNFYVVDQKLAMFLDMLVSFLENSPAFHNDKKAKEAIKEIKEVRAEEFKITVPDVTRVIQKSIQEERIQCSKDIAKESKDYIEELQKLRSEIETIATKSINEIISEKHKAIEKITSTASLQVSAGKDEIVKATKDARTEIESFVKGTNTQLRERLRKDLLDWNKSKHNEIPITPLFDDTEVPITDFYVRPQLVSVERQSYGSVWKRNENTHQFITRRFL
ncbi:uncharacterized protein CXorf38 homolog [Ruditapes philippinarum]|uniref:uncharacterized protein CXorf38 homolog n=1 Tax=Ruditapes philippinarum TaxID=129788 RepID=UPI00295AF831|nr:uncharacterized protein CXorf38 homolog [Ruditapes philippinarum]